MGKVTPLGPGLSSGFFATARLNATVNRNILSVKYADQWGICMMASVDCNNQIALYRFSFLFKFVFLHEDSRTIGTKYLTKESGQSIPVIKYMTPSAPQAGGARGAHAPPPPPPTSFSTCWDLKGFEMIQKIVVMVGLSANRASQILKPFLPRYDLYLSPQSLHLTRYLFVLRIRRKF